MTRRGARSAHRLTLLTLCGFLALLAVIAAGWRSPADATWSATGTGTGVGATATIGPATALSAAQAGNAVNVGWTAAVPPAGSTLTGYYVTRYAGAVPANACGTNPALPATYLAAAAVSCVDSSVTNGTYTYTVTAVMLTWSVESAPSNALVVNIDGTAPGLALGLGSGGSGAFLSGTTLWYASANAGSVTLSLAVTDAQSGPASATFPLVSATGWTHAAETVTSGTGSPPTITYLSSPFTWTAAPSSPGPVTVSGHDLAGNASSIPVTFSADTSAPTGGSLTVNGVAASGAGSQSNNVSGTFTLGPRVDYSADTGSGVASSILTRQSATYVNGVCGTFGATTTLVGTPAQSGLATGCYRYTLTGTDRVGNAASISSIVRVDATAPTQSLALAASSNAYLIPGRLYFRGAVAGSFQLAASVTDGESGPAQTTFPAIATTGWTHNAEVVSSGTGSAPTITYPSSVFSWTAAPSVPATKNIISADAAGNTVTTALAFTRDNTAPTGGALRVNSTNASAAGTTSNNSTGSFTVATRTDYLEVQSTTQSGLASSVLTRESAPLAGAACGSYGSAVTLAGAPAESGLTTGCYRYTLTGTDNVGNPVAISTTVRVDLSAPVGASLVVNGQAADTVTTTSSNGTGSWPIDVRTDWTDPEWATTTSTLTRQTAAVANGACGTFGASTTIVGTPAQTGTARNCYRYTLTGTNTAGLVSTISVIVKVDPYVTGVQLLNGPGVAGRVSAGDSMVVTFSGAIDSSSFCTAWGASGNQAINGDSQVTVSLNNVAGSDTVTVTSTLCTFRFGTMSLGSAAYTTATTTFGGAGVNKSTIAWDASARTLTVTLGTASGASPATVASSVATFTPSTSILGSGGLALGGTFATANIQQF